MELYVATATSLQFSHSSLSQSPSCSSSQTFPSFPARRRSSFFGGDGVLFFRYAEKSPVRAIKKVLKSSLNHPLSKFPVHWRPFADSETPQFPESEEIIPANIESIANSVDIPFSLKMIRRKRQWQKGLLQAGATACCSVDKAFSSTVFIIREMQRFTLQMKELQGILGNVHSEIHASFVWLFQNVFSQTPTLMVHLMILLANYSVYAMSTNLDLASILRFETYMIQEVLSVESENSADENMDSSVISKSTFSSSVGEIGGGGGKYRSIASGFDGDDRFKEPDYHHTNWNNPLSTNEEESSSLTEQEDKLWSSFADEAYQMQAESRDESLDHETMMRFVAPVDARIESEDKPDIVRTEMLYHMQLAEEPNNSLLLANFAQFLYLVSQNFDRAEEYFKRATNGDPKDAEAFNKYANFLWVVKKDLLAAEQAFLEAMDIEPDNSFYLADYAQFLLNTGGEDTCFI